MKWLSLFDGMSCLQIAAKELGISPEAYYASETDKHAIKQTQINFPETVQLGDVTMWESWDIDWSKITLIGAGSPCQGFSFAGKQLAFDDPRSKLFFVFIDILNYCRKFNPRVKFLLENVDMAKKHKKVINDFTGVFPVNINSNLVSAQNRNRYYWSNIRVKQLGLFGEIHTDIPHPLDRGIFLRDVLDVNVPDKYYLSDRMLDGFNNRKTEWKEKFNPTVGDKKANYLTARCYKMGVDDNYILYLGMTQRSRGNNKGGEVAKNGKTPPLTASSWHHNNFLLSVGVCLTPKRTEYGKMIRKDYEKGKVIEKRKNIQQLEPRLDGKTNTLSTVQKDNLIIQLNLCSESGGNQPYQHNRIYDINSISPVLMDGGELEYRIRRLTPGECARLQTIPEWYKWECSDTQQYKMLGNGWTIEVIKHILGFYND